MLPFVCKFRRSFPPTALAWVLVAGCNLNPITQRNAGNEDAFCRSVKGNDYGQAKRLINGYLITLRTDAQSRAANFEAVKSWLKKHPCAAEVVVTAGEIETLPPIKQFLFRLSDTGGKVVTFDISLSERGWQLSRVTE